MLKFWRTRKVK